MRAWDRSHDAFMSHIMPCRSCSGASGRYCAQGTTLRAEYMADWVMSLPSQQERRQAMIAEKTHNPDLYPTLRDIVQARLDAQEAA